MEQVYSGFKFTVGGSSLLWVQANCGLKFTVKFTVGSSLQRVQACMFSFSEPVNCCAEFRNAQDQNCNNLRLHVINCTKVYERTLIMIE